MDDRERDEMERAPVDDTDQLPIVGAESAPDALDNASEATMPPADSLPPPPRKPRAALTVAVVAVVAVLAGGAFVAARMLAAKPGASEGGGLMTEGGPGTGSGGGSGEFVSKGEGGGASLSTQGSGGRRIRRADIERPKELPDREPDVMGLIEERKDNTLLVGTGRVTIGVGPDGASASSDGPKLEVVLTGKTKLYRDDTMEEVDPANPPKDGEIKMKVTALDSLPDLGTGATAQAWGRKVGDRLIADVVVISTPMVVRGAGPN